MHFLQFPFFFLLGLHISMGPSRFPVLRIGSDPTEVSGSGRMGGESDGLAMVVHRGVPREPPFPLGKGKGKINEIRYPSGSEYLRAAIQNAEVMGPSRVEPLYGEIFATWYGSALGVQVWCLLKPNDVYVNMVKGVNVVNTQKMI